MKIRRCERLKASGFTNSRWYRVEIDVEGRVHPVNVALPAAEEPGPQDWTRIKTRAMDELVGHLERFKRLGGVMEP